MEMGGLEGRLVKNQLQILGNFKTLSVDIANFGKHVTLNFCSEISPSLTFIWKRTCPIQVSLFSNPNGSWYSIIASVSSYMMDGCTMWIDGC